MYAHIFKDYLENCYSKIAGAELNKFLKSMKGRKIDGIDTHMGDGITSLMRTVEFKDMISTTKLLLESGANPNARKTRNGYTPLMISVKNENSEAVDILLAHGADTEIKNDATDTVLMMAVKTDQCCSYDIVESLIQHGADVKVVSWLTSETLISEISLRRYSSTNDTDKILDLLLRCGGAVHINRHAPVDAFTPLMQAVYWGRLPKVRILLKYGADVSLRNAFKDTALALAVREKRHDIMEVLLEEGADVEDNLNRHGLLFSVIADGDHFKEAEVLLDYNINVDAKDMFGKTTLDLAIELERTDIVSMLQNHVKTVIPLKNIVIRSLKESHKAEFKKHGGGNDAYKMLTTLKNQKVDRIRSLSFYGTSRKRKIK